VGSWSFVWGAKPTKAPVVTGLAIVSNLSAYYGTDKLASASHEASWVFTTWL